MNPIITLSDAIIRGDIPTSTRLFAEGEQINPWIRVDGCFVDQCIQAQSLNLAKELIVHHTQDPYQLKNEKGQVLLYDYDVCGDENGRSVFNACDISIYQGDDPFELTRTNQVDRLRQILEHQDINRRDKAGFSLLYYALFQGNEEIVHLLVDAGADLNLKFLQAGNYYFYLDLATFWNHCMLVQYLFDHKAPCSAETKKWAIFHRNCDVLERYYNKDWKVLFKESMNNSDIHIVDLLFEKHGIPEDVPLVTGPFIDLCVHSKYLDLCDALLSKTFPSLLVDRCENPLFEKYLKQGNDEVIDLFLKHGIDPNGRAENGWSWLSVAVFLRHWNIVESLLAYKADLNSIDQIATKIPLDILEDIVGVCSRVLIEKLLCIVQFPRVQLTTAFMCVVEKCTMFMDSVKNHTSERWQIFLDHLSVVEVLVRWGAEVTCLKEGKPHMLKNIMYDCIQKKIGIVAYILEKNKQEIACHII